MILTCANCSEQFVASYDQRKRVAQGRTVFMCSLSCRGQYNKRVHTEVSGQVPMSVQKLARSRVRGALRRGDITRPSACEYCGAVARLQAHHHAGYEKHLVIKWLCNACHLVADGPERFKRGSQHCRAKLAETDIPAIRECLRNGVSLNKVAALYSVSKKTIVNIKLNRIWRHA